MGGDSSTGAGGGATSTAEVVPEGGGADETDDADGSGFTVPSDVSVFDDAELEALASLLRFSSSISLM